VGEGTVGLATDQPDLGWIGVSIAAAEGTAFIDSPNTWATLITVAIGNRQRLALGRALLDEVLTAAITKDSVDTTKLLDVVAALAARLTTVLADRTLVVILAHFIALAAAPAPLTLTMATSACAVIAAVHVLVARPPTSTAILTAAH
jgi:hypothetical protein